MRTYKIEMVDGENYEGYFHDDGKIENTVIPSIEPLARVDERLTHITHMSEFMQKWEITRIEMNKV